MDGQRIGDAPKRVIDETKRLYANLLSKSLDERQLAKPSFKFIQEIAKRLITEAKTLRNVFNPTDFETEHKTWDRRRKCEFIQRLIDFAANNKQPVVGCVAAKLVAGLEPIKANELLQSLAKIAQARLSGPDGNSKRPRTFTRQIPSASSKQPIGAKNPATSAIPSRRNSPDSRPRADSKRITPSTSRNLSAGSVGVVNMSDDIGSERRRVTSAEMPLPVARSSLSKVGATDDMKLDNQPESMAFEETSEKSPLGSGLQIQTLTKRQSATRLSSSSIGSNQPSSQSIIVSESDIGKHIQQLRSSLDQFHLNLMELGQFDLKLRSDLVANLGQFNRLAQI